MKPAVFASSLFLLLAFSWFVTIELILQHHGFITRAAIAALIVLYAALTLLYTRASTTALRSSLTVASLTAIWLGFLGIVIALKQTHFEGYLLILAAILSAQGTLTLIHLLYPRPHLRTT